LPDQELIDEVEQLVGPQGRCRSGVSRTGTAIGAGMALLVAACTPAAPTPAPSTVVT
jgi:hypothetical protein